MSPLFVPAELGSIADFKLHARQTEGSMSDVQKLVVFELNEVPFKVFDRFVSMRPNSQMARLFCRSDVFETFSEDEGHLSPWVTWPTVHRGVTNQKHGILDFGQNLTEVDAEYPPIWELLARAGVRPGVFGPLHSYPLPRDISRYDFFVPDTFAAGPECFPKKLSEFQAFNLAMVDSSGRNVARNLMLSKAMPFLMAAPGLGLRGRTVASLGTQLLRERIRPELVCRRRTSQVEIAFDFYLKQLRSRMPDVSFFFTNHVASSLHRYWPGTFPQDYPKALWAEGYERTYADEIDFTMSVADRMIGELARFVERTPGHRLLVMTSMGQQAVPNAEQTRTQLLCIDLKKLMSALGVAPGLWERRRAMAPQYVVTFAPDSRKDLISNLCALSINGTPVHFSDHGDSVMIEFGQVNLDDNIRLESHGEPRPLQEFGLRNVEIQDKSASFAYHIPQGVLLSYDPQKRKGHALERRRNRDHRDRAGDPAQFRRLRTVVHDGWTSPELIGRDARREIGPKAGGEAPSAKLTLRLWLSTCRPLP